MLNVWQKFGYMCKTLYLCRDNLLLILNKTMLMKKFLLMLLTASAVSAYAQGPAVTAEETEVTSTTITLTFTPNEETGHYYACLFGQGEMEAQYNMFGAWMGFTCYGDMVKSWGFDCVGEQTKTWTSLNPGSTYDIWVQPTDASGAYGELQCFTITTVGQGGTGEAVITVEIGEFGGDEVNGYWQQVINTPNEETAVYFDQIFDKSYYLENGLEGMQAYLQEEDDPSSFYYDYYAQFGVDNAVWNANPGTTYYACAIGKNAAGEWGEMTVVEFTTPGGETAIQNVEAKAENGVRYNLQGQKTNSSRGLTIQNGKLILNK